MPFFEAVNEFLNTPLGKAALSLVSGGTLGTLAWKARGWLAAGVEEQLAGSRADLDAERRTSTELRHEVEKLRMEPDELRRQLGVCQQKRELFRVEGSKLSAAHKKLVADHSALRIECDSLRASEKVLREHLGDAGGQLDALRQELDGRRAELDRVARQTGAALKLEGNLWAAKALQKVRRFRPLAQRQTPIISVLNLKGGVGKTTVTGNLSVAMARRGYRVLLLDLDLQGSLSQMYLEFDKQQALAEGGRLIHHFFRAAAVDQKTKLKDFAQEVARFPESGGLVDIVAASDDLAYAEFSLTLSWLLKRGKRDNRFLLRKSAQLMEVCNAYDVVLIDCPPLVNMSCINALAASDYLLIPVTLGRQSMERVPALLKRFLRDERFRKSINHSLHVLGLVANRVQRDALTAAERSAWQELATWCRDAYGQDVKQFDTVIPQLGKDIRENEAVGGVPGVETRIAQVFAALVAEIEQELPDECRRRPKALS